ncbi:bifunctional pyridoxamine 5'-phosphate oxidase family protein/GNAT family N-acetyltransferase [Plantactinospora soyae]|uniref:RimJ/RimL family protein N-acetyltransferase/nitroimidazol reductase NimA-like FMN-containing flavoprotein (Pyridoxamine 5'-phosphate oxidase superfamily) n=1 Tax=Plantactinospora soyae TaxID=1544732 RepID=A0A927M9X7_9ACTN|nr:bifunctional pyridoxamine 5'-phosphate oxidase family protein/GNAT family N-acetyltransferase [Plantactinospora soyae]MBE1487988.1 RimJ/RimL family protein N-acetyltransferase/nitroimidazol reductase NimA-like FMN-containing flavoprotein (pyridoxamine 5'-phosphate oxidase superfamily) [Plantactinospora soyae]
MYEQTHRTTATRDRARTDYRRDAAHELLDSAYHCHLGFAVDGEPRVLPTLHVRIGETLYLHGSTGSRPLLAARSEAGLAVCVAITHLDGLVYARSQFHHSANYRSVVVHGSAHLVTAEAEKAAVLTALVEKVGRGRSGASRPPNRRELAETAVLALPLREVSVRTRTGGVREEPADLALPYWAGVLPLRMVTGRPEPDTGVTAPLPDHLLPALSPWHTPAPMAGAHVRLEPLAESHVEGLWAAGRDPEVWQHLSVARPTDPDELADVVRAALDAGWRGERVPWVQLDAGTGEVIGTTSYYEVNPQHRAVAIGHTFLGRRWWRTGVNTEAKLLLLTRAFEELGAQRVVWHTDIRNERSQRAIERLGARREAVLRRHRQRPDGSWRDTVQYVMIADEWPEAQLQLRKRLRSAVPAGR